MQPAVRGEGDVEGAVEDAIEGDVESAVSRPLLVADRGTGSSRGPAVAQAASGSGWWMPKTLFSVSWK